MRLAIAIVPGLLLHAGCGGSQPDTRPPDRDQPVGIDTARPSPAAGPPVAARKPVSTTYHGVDVTEHYRWLENWEDPEVKKWTRAQNAHARRHLSSLPGFEAIEKRVAEIEDAPSVGYWNVQIRESAVFAMKFEPPVPVPFLVVMPNEDAADRARVLVDPTRLDKEGLTTIDFYTPSPDGHVVAVSLSSAGTEEGNLHFFDTATGRQVHGVIPRVNGGTAGGSVAWSPDSKGVYYTRYPRAGERSVKDMSFFVQVYYHALGTAADKDRYEIGKEFPRIAEIQLDMDQGTGRLLATVQNGDGGQFAHYLRAKNGSWKQFSKFGDRIVQAAFGPRNDLYLLSFQDAPRGKILRAPIAKLDPFAAKVVVPEGEGAIPVSFWSSPSVLPTRTRLYVTVQIGGPSKLAVFDLAGKPLAAPEQPDVASIGSLTWNRSRGDAILFGAETFAEPQTFYRHDPKKKTTKATSLVEVPPAKVENVEVRREFATSKDGTKVPLNIVMPKGTQLDGKSPCIATGYGGYGSSVEPRHASRNAISLEQGVIHVAANLRGGGEYGEAWHLQGNLTNKQNVFDDFAAVLQHLIDRGYTSSDRLAIIGGSNGGLLMGALMTQYPDRVKAVVSYVGIYDQLRTELSPNGEFNITEFGTVKIKEQFEAMYAYSPYHRVKQGTKYPATLFHAGNNDPRVEPWQSRKMTAALQHAQAGDAPILFRTDDSAGHGRNTQKDERIEQAAQVWAFLFDQLGVTYSRPQAR
jgi:prolyl oligopeptidase